MAANRSLRVGPVHLTATLTTNILNPAAAGSGTGYTPTASYIILRHIRLVNTDSSARTVSLFIGATGADVAGTEFLGSALSIPATSAYDWYGQVRLDAADFLTGGASVTNVVTFEAEGEVGLA